MRNELEVIGDGDLTRAVAYTLSHSLSSLAVSLNVTMQRDMSRPYSEYKADDLLRIRTAGYVDDYRVTDTGTDGYTHSISLLSEDIDIAYKCATKELRFMSMDSLEYKDFQKYLSQEGSDIVNLNYVPYIQKIEYVYYVDRPTEIEGGWWSYGTPGSIFEVLATILGIKVICTLPPFRVKQFSVSAGSSIYHSMIELVSPFTPTVFIKNETLYILEPDNSDLTEKLIIRTAEQASEQIAYKENTNPDDVIFRGGQCMFNVNRYEGPIFPQREAVSIPVSVPVSYYSGGPQVDEIPLGFIDLVTYGGWPVDEYEESNLETPGYGVTKSTQTTHQSVWDVFHSRRTRWHSLTEDYAYNNITGELDKISDVEEFNRYRYLDPCFESSRADSGHILSRDMLETFGGVPFEIRTLNNWSTLKRHGKMQWGRDGATGEYKFLFNPNARYELEWNFYDEYGRLAVRSVRTYCDVHTICFVPFDFATYKLRNIETIPWKIASDIAYTEGAQLSGTTIKCVPHVSAPYEPFDPRTLVDDTLEMFIPEGKRMYRVNRKRTFLDPSIQRFQTESTAQSVPSDKVPKSTVTPKQMNMVFNKYTRSAPLMLDKPQQVVSHPHVWIESEGYEIFNFMRKHVSPSHVERTLVLPYTFYVPKNSMIDFVAIKDFKGRDLLKDREVNGQVVQYSMTNSANRSSTTITARGVIEYET